MAKKKQIRLADDFLNIQVDTPRINPNRTCDWTKAWNMTSRIKMPLSAKSWFASRVFPILWSQGQGAKKLGEGQRKQNKYYGN